MHKKLKDTDYLGISTRVRAMENRLLTRERMERMIEARTSEEAAKVLTECGYGELSNVTASGLDEVLAQARDAVYKDMRSSVPDHNLIDVFQMKYDYHNAKVLLKAEAMGLEVTSSLPTNLELNAGGVNKGRGLLALAKALGFAREQVMACGDSGNDAAMLKAVGLGVAMGNATPDILAAADAVTDTNDRDGVAKALERFVLNG